MFATTALAIMAAFSAVLPTEALHLQTRQSDGGKGLTSPGAVGFDYPPLRGWSLDAGKKPICGGFDLHARTDFPASKSATLPKSDVDIDSLFCLAAGGPLALVQQRDGYDVQLSYSSDPSEFRQFHFRSSRPSSLCSADPTELSHFTPMFPNHTHLLPGTACYTAPNFEVGSDITFMLTYQVRHGCYPIRGIP